MAPFDSAPDPGSSGTHVTRITRWTDGPPESPLPARVQIT
jgi:hypothetical protein